MIDPDDLPPGAWGEEADPRYDRGDFFFVAILIVGALIGGLVMVIG